MDTSEIFNLSALCRCCHRDGNFKSLNFFYYNELGEIEVYANMLQAAFGLTLIQPTIEASYSICDICIEKLRNALQFKKQVQECEMKFEDYCKNEMALQIEIKIENEICDDVKSQVSVKLEDSMTDVQDNFANTALDEVDIKIPHSDYKKEDIIITTVEQIYNEKTGTENATIQNKGSFDEDKKLKTDSKSNQKKNLEKRRSVVSKAKLKWKKNTKKKLRSKLDSTDVEEDDFTNTLFDVDIEELHDDYNKGENIDSVKQLDIEKTDTSNTTIPNEDRLDEEKTLKTDSKSEQKRNSGKLKSAISKVKIKRKNNTEKKTISKLGNHITEQSKGSNIPKLTGLDTDVFVCQTCNKPFKTYSGFRVHQQKQHSIFICIVCKTDFGTKTELEMHKTIHTNSMKKHECVICSRVYKIREALSAHMSMQHTKEKVFTCDICNKDFGYKSSLRKHIEYHLGTNKKCMCDLCGRAFNDFSNLNIHIRTVHEKLKLFNCDRCPKVFARNKSLRIHLRTHTGERPYKCQFCNKTFICSTAQKLHTQKHHPVSLREDSNETQGDPAIFPVYVCKVCGKHCSSRSSFASHTRSHIGDKPYKCHYCEKDFTCKYSQKRHIQIHEQGSERRKFPCGICYKSFTGRAQMVRHMKTVHDPNKPFMPKTKCTLCKMSVRDMQKHMKTHTGRLLQCPHCPRAYSETSTLNRHVREVHSGVAHHCDLCHKQYIKPRSLRDHKIKAHDIHAEFKQEQENDRDIKQENR